MIGKKLRAGQIRAEPELFELMADSVTDYAIFLLDEEGNVASWNKGALLIKHYTAEEVIGKHFSIFYTDEDKARDWPAQELKLAAQTGRFEDEGWRVRKDGSRFWANVIITALKDENGEILAYAKITRDLTERRAVEENLRQSEERFRLLVEGVRDYAIYMLDPHGMVTSWNGGAEQITGYTEREIVGRHFSTFYSAEDIKNGKPEAELALARVYGRAEDEGSRVRKNGTRFWARVVVTPLYDTRGGLRGYAKVTQDLTQRKHAEALEGVTRNINEFIAVLAHEIRNPLAPIRSAVTVLKAEPQLKEQTSKVVQIIDRQSAQLMRIVDDIIDVSRITRGKISIVKKEVSVMDLINRSLETARPAIDAKNHTLTVDTAQAPATIIGDEIRLSQALTNLLNNATRYTDRGGQILLKASAEQRNGISELVLLVKDNGRGIAPELRSSIFDMFVQAENRRNNSGAGLGVGLALARTIVELHQGVIEVKSEGAGLGSEFVLRIPLAQPLTEASDTAANNTARDKISILVVDDNQDAAALLTATLQHHGQTVFTANSGGEGLELFEKHHPDLILLDIGMPGMSGYELARNIRSNPHGKATYLVAITGWGKDEDRYHSKEAGIDLHLVKPVEPEELIAILNSKALSFSRNQIPA